MSSISVSPMRTTLLAVAGCAMSLLGTACTHVMGEGATSMSTGAGGDSGHGGHGSGGAEADAGPIKGTCPQSVPTTHTNGSYNFFSDVNDCTLWAVKRDDANDRCMLLHLAYGAPDAFGLAVSYGLGVQQVILTNAAADCAYPGPLSNGQRVEATCGTGKYRISPTPDGPGGLYVDASFEFPPTYGWVPASDTFCVQNCYGADVPNGWIPGC